MVAYMSSLFGCKGHKTHLKLELGKRKFIDIHERPWSNVVNTHLCSLSFVLPSAMLVTSSLRLPLCGCEIRSAFF